MCLFIPSNGSCSRNVWSCLWLLLLLGGHQSAHFQITGFRAPSAGSVPRLILLLRPLVLFCPVVLSCPVLHVCLSDVLCCGWDLRLSFFPVFLPFLLAALGLCCCVWTPLVVVIRATRAVLRFFSWPWRLILWKWALGTQASAVAAHRLSCPVVCGLFLDQGSNICPLQCRRTLNHCATREVLKSVLKPQLSCLGLSCAGLGVRLTLICRVRVIPYLACQISPPSQPTRPFTTFLWPETGCLCDVLATWISGQPLCGFLP